MVSVLEPLVLLRRKERLLEVLGARLDSVTLVMDAPHDPHNGAAMVRSCDAFGVATLHVIERIEPFLIADSVSTGTEQWVEIVAHSSVEAAVGRLRAEGRRLVIADPKGTMLPEDLARIPRLALVVGNEKDGVCETLRAQADDSVRIPMRGFVESLNVSVSAALLLRAATQDRPGDLTPEQRLRAYASGLVRTVPRAREVLGNLQPR